MHCSTIHRFLLFSFETDPRKILMTKNHARERNKPVYTKTKVSTFANFEVGRLVLKEEEDGEIGGLAFL